MTGGPFSPNLANASPNRTAKNSTCSRLLSVNALNTDSGMMFSRKSTVWGSSLFWVFFAIASAPAASVAALTWKPAPGLTMLPTTSPKSSAKVVTASK